MNDAAYFTVIQYFKNVKRNVKKYIEDTADSYKCLIGKRLNLLKQ